MLTPLIANDQVYNLSMELYPKVVELSEGIAHIGIGIGSLMLLIVIIYYVLSLLEGGKFQMKMLIPMLLFFVVCNFSWVAKPVLAFTTTMTETLVLGLNELRLNALNPDGSGEINNPNDHYIANNLEDDPTNDSVENQPQNEEDHQGNEASGTVGESSQDGFMRRFIDMFFNRSSKKVVDEFATTETPDVIKKKTSERLTLTGVICQLMSWLASAFSYCLKIFGIMMTSIMIGFGPIIFAFAMIPGRGSNIMSWFIRICQFALFSPICAFIDAFTACCYSLLDSSLGSSWLMVFALTIANLVGLLSVPTIASMVIEGASGAASLSQGLQTLGGATMTAGGILTAATVGKDNALNNFMEGFKHKGLVGTLSEVRNNGVSGAMKNITEYGRGALYGWNQQAGGAGSGGESPTGSAGGPAAS